MIDFPTPSHPRPIERAIIDMCRGLDSWLTAWPADPFNTEYVVAQMASAIENALTHDLGRLSGAAVSGWLCGRLTAAGIDPDTKEMM